MNKGAEFPSAGKGKGARLRGRTPRAWWPYVVAVLSVAAAWLLRMGLDRWLQNYQPFSAFYLAVAFVAWRYGRRTAVLAQGLGLFCGDWFFVPPRGTLMTQKPAQAIELLMYLAVSTALILLIYSLRRQQRRAEGALVLARQKERELQGDIAVRQDLEARLTRRGEELEALVRQRTARLIETINELKGFSYSLTHDMRAPLRAMLSFTEMLENDGAGQLSASSEDMLRRIKLAARRLDQLITDALDYSKLVSEEMALEPIQLAKLLRGMIETYPTLQPPGAELNVEVSELTVLANSAALTQCFSNLLSNAIKFVAPGTQPHVRIWAEELPPTGPSRQSPDALPQTKGDRSPPRVRIWIEDNGIGIAQEAQERIFGMFQRMHRQDEYSGTGIGLTIVRKAVERMGGRVGLESEPGKGSRFWIELISEDSP